MMKLYSVFIFFLFLSVNFSNAQVAYSDFSESYKAFNKTTDTLEKLKNLRKITKWDYRNHSKKIDSFLASVGNKQNKSREELLLYYMVRGHIYYFLNNYNKSIYYLEEAAKDSLSLSSQNLFLIYGQLYTNYQYTSNFGASIYYLKKLERIRDTLDVNSPAYKDLNDYRITEENIYYKAGMVSKAISILLPKYNRELLKKDSDELLLLSCSNNLGLYYLAIQKPDSAIAFFRKSLSHYNKIPDGNTAKDVFLLATLKGNLGEAYFNQKEYELAERFLREDIETNKDYAPESAAWSTILLAKCYLSEKKIANAGACLDTYPSFDFPRDNFKKLKVEYLVTLAWYYSLNRKFEDSYNALKEATALKDSLYLEDKENSDQKSEFAFILSLKNKELQSKQNEVSNLMVRDNDRESELGEVKLQYYKILILSLILLVLLIYVIVLSYRGKRNNKVLSKLNSQIAETNEIIKREVHQKEEDALNINSNKEAYIQLILSILGNAIENYQPDTKTCIKNEIERRMSIAMRIHRPLYVEADINKIDMDNYLNVLTTLNLNEKIKFTIAASQVCLTMEQATGIALLVYELFRNSYQVMKETGEEFRIVLSLINLKDCCQFIYRDNIMLEEIPGELIHGNEAVMISELSKKLKGYYKTQYKKGVYFEMMFNHQ